MKFLWDVMIALIVIILVIFIFSLIFHPSVSFENYFLRVWYYIIGYIAGWLIGRQK